MHGQVSLGLGWFQGMEAGNAMRRLAMLFFGTRAPVFARREPLLIATGVGELDEGIVRRLFLQEDPLQDTRRLGLAEEGGPGVQATVRRDGIMVDLLRGGNHRGIDRGRALEFGGEVLAFL